MTLDPCIPTDSFFESLPKRSSICVGFCTNPISQPNSNRDLLIQLASHWSLQTNRRSCVITGPCRFDSQSHSNCLNLTLIQWDWLDTTDHNFRTFSKTLARDISTLSRLRSENGLILIDLGPLDLPLAQNASKLCDGLALLLDDTQENNSSNSPSLRRVLGTLESYQRPECRWLGFWRIQNQGLGI